MISTTAVMEQIKEACEAALSDAGRSVDLATLYPGSQVAWDDQCGQLYVSSGPIRADYDRNRTRIASFHQTVAVGVLRCVSTVQDHGVFPGEDELTEDTDGNQLDAHIVMTTLACLKLDRASKLTLDNWNPVGPQGAMAGGEWKCQVFYTAGQYSGAPR